MTGPQTAQIMQEIARRYYIEGEGQQQIAKQFSISRSQVSKLLKRAKEEGMIQFDIADPSSSTASLAAQLRRMWSLKDAVIAPDRKASRADTAVRVGREAAAYVKTILKDGMSIGIEWGTSLYCMVEQLEVDRSYDIDVYQLHGVIESSMPDVEGVFLARKLSSVLGGRGKLIQAPMLVASTQLRDMLVSEQKISQALAGASKVDVACIGIGSNETGENELAKAGYLSREESLRILDEGGSATVSGWFIDREGNVLADCANDRIIGVHPDAFKEIPRVIAVAYGENKKRSIISALRGGFVDVLITDESTARGILQEYDWEEQAASIPKEVLKEIYIRMQRSRKLDERIDELFQNGQLHGTTHLSIGQEASSVVPGCALEEKDLLFGTHRSHGQVIGKGMTSFAIMAELFGKVTGCSGGRGGSMHLAAPEKGIMGTDGVVAGTLPVAVGAGLSARLLGEQKAVAAFLGDGATNEGAFHEAMNLASLWKLPVMFLCENNQYGFSLPVEKSVPVAELASRSASYGMPGWIIDGNDAVRVYQTVKKARAYVLEHGPVFIVMETYRISGHSKSDSGEYRERQEVDQWRRNCPLERLKQALIRCKVFSADELAGLLASLDQEIFEAEAAARKDPSPNPADVMEYVYS